MLRVIVLLEGEPLSQSQISGRQKQVSLNNFPVFSAFIIPSILTSYPVPVGKKTSPQHDAATTMIHCGDRVFSG